MRSDSAPDGGAAESVPADDTRVPDDAPSLNFSQQDVASACMADVHVRAELARVKGLILEAVDADVWRVLGYPSANDYIATIDQPSPFLTPMDDR